MGKQINFYIEYELTVMLAQKALEYGCKIIKLDTVNGIVTESDNTDIISGDFAFYFFHVPEAGEYRIIKSGERETVDHGYNASGITLIELIPTSIRTEKKELQSGRLFCISDYYDEKGRVIKRPDCVTPGFIMPWHVSSKRLLRIQKLNIMCLTRCMQEKSSRRRNIYLKSCCLLS